MTWKISSIFGRVFRSSFLLQDFSKEHMDKLGYGIYTIMDINLLPPLHLIYADNPSDSGKVRELAKTGLLIFTASDFITLLMF